MARVEDRYISLTTKVLPDGRTVYQSAIPIDVEGDPNTDPTIVTNERDRMDVIAHNVYGSSMDWWRIAAANKHVNGSLHILPGTKLIIPSK